MTSRKRKNVTLQEKYDIVQLFKNGVKQSTISKDKNIPRSTLNAYCKEAESIILQYESGSSTSVKRIKSTNCQEIEAPLLQFFRMARDQKVPVSGDLLLEKAKNYASILDLDTNLVDINWVNRWKKRNNIVVKNLHGEAASADLAGANEWLQNRVPTLLNEYEPENIFNCDETGLFYR